MLQLGQQLYRFKFDISEENIATDKHTFAVIDIDIKERFNQTIVSYKTRCLEDYKIKYLDGHHREESDMHFNQARASGSAVYVLLLEDDFNKAHQIVSDYFDEQVQSCKDKLAKLESVSSRIKALM